MAPYRLPPFSRLLASLLCVFLFFGMSPYGIGQAFASIVSQAYQSYQINGGDTLWLLSQRYSASTSDIRTLNRLTTDALHNNQTIMLPVLLEGTNILYRVQPGDTLFLISNRVKRSIDAIKAASNLKSDMLFSGQTLRVPAAREGAQLYVAKAGDSLFNIGQRFGVSVDRLVDFNRLNSSQILAGQIIEVPGTGSAPPPAAPPPAPSPPPSAGLPVHRVQTGETLSSIAARYQTTVNAIYVTNRLNVDYLMVGQPLYIPVGNQQPVQVAGPRGEQRPGFGELLDWEWARWIYNPGSTATVTDLQTGLRWRIHHLGGSNHADSEPLTAADTRIMKQAFGGQWSWSARAVLLEVNNRVLAASINGMPHSIQTISNNDFPGHFCLYFFNSRTHTTNTIPPDYQAMVLKAAGR
ncbi:MAG: LysM peptidoglycan-binding domain-containing protein [Bacillota bacterium]